jgi:hypothetical protein
MSSMGAAARAGFFAACVWCACNCSSASSAGGPGGAAGRGDAGNPGGTGGGAGQPVSDGGLAEGGPSFSECRGVALGADGVLDLNLRAIHVSGVVKLAGGVLPDESGGRGQILFEDALQGARATVDLGSTGAMAYALTLPPGKYDVRFSGNAKLCSGGSMPKMPCGGGTLLSGVDLRSDGVMDLDIPVARVSGSVTLKGAPFPAETVDRGAIRFTGSGGSVVTSEGFGTSGAATYSLTLLPGTYDIAFIGNPALCDRTQAPQVPCNSGTVRRAADIRTGVLDLDIGAVKVTGNVTVAGAELPDEAMGRGHVSFSADGGSVASSRDIGSTGPATYAVTLLPATYDVGFAGNPMLCAAETASHTPCNAGTISKAVSILADGNLDLELTPVTVSGVVTLNGAPFPTESADRGALQFARAEGSVTTKAFGSSGAAKYQLTLLAGDYSVLYAANASLCGTGAAPRVPCVSGPLLSSRPLAASGVLDVDVRGVRVSGAVTVNGAAPADASGSRGQLVFSMAGGGSVTTPPFAATGPISYGLTLIPGSYAARFSANAKLCAADALPHVPCVSGTLVPAASLAADGVLDLDVPMRTITGAVTLLGAPLPAESQNRGSISFALLDPVATGAAVAADLKTTGPASYGITVLPGRYVVSHQANAALCGPGVMPNVPCASQVVVGCE